MSSRQGKRIGILGGTFNPVHLGHLILAQSAVESCELDRVIFVPCSLPPHKRAAGLAAAEHRYAMIAGAIEGDLRFEASDMEIRRGGVSYAVDTLRQLRKQYRQDSLHFIIGSDSLPELHRWKEIGEILTLCTFATFGRPGAKVDAGGILLPPPWPERLAREFRELRLIDISSSDIRHRVAEGLSIRYLVPSFVEMYIAEHNLYTQ